MRRITIRNLKSQKATKPRVFDAIVDGNEVYFEVKVGNKGNEVIALTDVMKQISSSESEEEPRARIYRAKRPK